MYIIRALLCVSLTIVIATPTPAADQPNILWITAEDMSPTLGCYGDNYATTPNIDALARQGVRYTHAFATAPVCSPVRSCLINGVYAPTQGTHNMRSAFPIPKALAGFPSYLRKAGYFTTNNVKTDYNSANWKAIVAASWDQSSKTAHWRDRKGDRPFFSVFNLMTSHQSRSMVWPYEKFQAEVQGKLTKAQVHDPAKARLPPYYPDTPLIRQTVARYYDCVTAMDQEVGAILKQLEDDGLTEDTIVFFYSDHGSGMPRHKRALLDSGMKVPFIIRFPHKYQHLAPGRPGTSTSRLVSFVDFAPTVLSLSGQTIPEYVSGRAFLGAAKTEPRRYAYGHRDRVDEVIDMARSVRDQKYLYIRNYMPHLGYNQPTAWPDLGAIRHEFYRLADRSKMTPAQWHFAGPSRAVEELYNCETDPLNLNNLAESAEHQQTLNRLRGALVQHLLASKDLGFIPEAQMWRRIGEGTTPLELARRYDERDLRKLINAASQVGTADESLLVANLRADDEAVRYWAAVGLSAASELCAEAEAGLRRALNDEERTVRIEAAGALARHGKKQRSIAALAESLEAKNLAAVLHAARTIELLGPSAGDAAPAMRRTAKRMRGLRPQDIPATVVLPGDVDMAMFIGFSTAAYLRRVDAGPSHVDGAACDWIALFDGKTLNGWRAPANSDKVRVSAVDGEIHMLSRGRNLWLSHERVFRDFELETEALMPSTYNSGIGFRCTKDGRFTGYQCEIDQANSGAIYAIGKGWVWPKGQAQTDEFKKMAGSSFSGGAWNRFRIRCRGDHIQVWVNDVKTADLRDPLFADGVVALQHHGKGDVHRFRNIRIRVLAAAQD